MSKTTVFIATGVFAIAGALATSALVSSCDTVCTAEARASVMVHVVDEAGNPVGADWVSYSVVEDPTPRDSSAVPGNSAECLDEDCTQWVAGYETEGLFVVTAEVCGRKVTGRVDVGMTDDGCHVETEDLYLEADTTNCERPRSVDLSDIDLQFPKPELGDFSAPEPTVCSREARPSVVVKVMQGNTSAAKAIRPTAVFYQKDGGAPLSAMCLDEDCLSWAAGWEEPGSFSVFVIHANKLLRGRTEVAMTEDGCHVATEVLNIMYEPESVDVDLVDKGPTLTARPPGCTYEARPSVIVEIVDGESEVADPVHAKSVWYEIPEVVETTRAMCREEPCGTWYAGIEQAGEFHVYADVCGQTLEGVTHVEHAEDGCHVETEYLKLVADITDCPK